MYIYISPLNDYFIFMGDDKYENEYIIKYGLPSFVWFHVDNFSSAHVYVKIPENISIKTLPETIINICCQIVKKNSIKGSKEPLVDVIYTEHSNLNKSVDMETGTIGFKNNSLVNKVRNVKNKAEIIKNLEKTRIHVKKTEEQFKKEKDEYERNLIKKNKLIKVNGHLKIEEEKKNMKAEYEQKHYLDLFKNTKKNNCSKKSDGTLESCRAIEDDFM